MSFSLYAKTANHHSVATNNPLSKMRTSLLQCWD